MILRKKGYLEEKFHKIITRYSALHKADFFFIQIGANDGMKFDPTYLYIHKYGWNGILIEPVDYVFKKLRKNYEGFPGIKFENVAIGDKNGSRKFYMLRKDKNHDLPFWYDEIGSFLKQNVMKHKDKIKDLDKRIIEKRVRVLTFNSLIKKHRIKKIDLLQIDTEGYDYNILKQIDFNNIKPAMILFEDRHLSYKDKLRCKMLLTKNGYNILEGLDSLAYLRNNDLIIK